MTKWEEKKSLTETEPLNSAVSEQPAEGVELDKPETVLTEEETKAIDSPPEVSPDSDKEANKIQNFSVKLKNAFSKEGLQLAGKRIVGAFSKKNVKTWAKRWFIDAFSGMALGLFATLIAGTIFAQIGMLIGETTAVGKLLIGVANVAKFAMGAGIGAGMAYMLKTDKLTMFCCIVAGLVGANYTTAQFFQVGTIAMGIGNPIGAYLATIFTIEVCKLVAGKTRLDIILVPLTAMTVTAIVAFLLCPPASWLVSKIAEGIEIATAWSPFLMGIVISVVMGILLTMPTSSAAIWVMIAAGNTSPIMLLAGGAAVVGCAAHMVGFAVMSIKENRLGGLIAQGLGTSMLQIPNIMKKPIIMVPPIIASAVVGPLATCVFRLKCGAAGGGMGTAGLVGVLSTIEVSGDIPVYLLVLGIIFCFFVLPAVISWGVCAIFKKLGWIKSEDLKLQL